MHWWCSARALPSRWTALDGVAGNVSSKGLFCARWLPDGGSAVNGLIYLIGLIVVILFILSFLGLR
jgi:hypothetical protein